MDKAAVFQDIFRQVRRDLIFPWFYSELTRRNVVYYIYYLSTGNIRIALNNGDVVLIKELENFVNVRFARDAWLVGISAQKFAAGSLTFQAYRKILASAGVFRWVTYINENRRNYYSFDDILLYAEDTRQHSPVLI